MMQRRRGGTLQPAQSSAASLLGRPFRPAVPSLLLLLLVVVRSDLFLPLVADAAPAQVGATFGVSPFFTNDNISFTGCTFTGSAGITLTDNIYGSVRAVVLRGNTIANGQVIIQGSTSAIAVSLHAEIVGNDAAMALSASSTPFPAVLNIKVGLLPGSTILITNNTMRSAVTYAGAGYPFDVAATVRIGMLSRAILSATNVTILMTGNNLTAFGAGLRVLHTTTVALLGAWSGGTVLIANNTLAARSNTNVAFISVSVIVLWHESFAGGAVLTIADNNATSTSKNDFYNIFLYEEETAFAGTVPSRAAASRRLVGNRWNATTSGVAAVRFVHVDKFSAAAYDCLAANNTVHAVPLVALIASLSWAFFYWTTTTAVANPYASTVRLEQNAAHMDFSSTLFQASSSGTAGVAFFGSTLADSSTGGAFDLTMVQNNLEVRLPSSAQADTTFSVVGGAYFEKAAFARIAILVQRHRFAMLGPAWAAGGSSTAPMGLLALVAVHAATAPTGGTSVRVEASTMVAAVASTVTTTDARTALAAAVIYLAGSVGSGGALTATVTNCDISMEATAADSSSSAHATVAAVLFDGVAVSAAVRVAVEDNALALRCRVSDNTAGRRCRVGAVIANGAAVVTFAGSEPLSIQRNRAAFSATGATAHAALLVVDAAATMALTALTGGAGVLLRDNALEANATTAVTATPGTALEAAAVLVAGGTLQAHTLVVTGGNATLIAGAGNAGAHYTGVLWWAASATTTVPTTTTIANTTVVAAGTGAEGRCFALFASGPQGSGVTVTMPALLTITSVDLQGRFRQPVVASKEFGAALLLVEGPRAVFPAASAATISRCTATFTMKSMNEFCWAALVGTNGPDGIALMAGAQLRTEANTLAAVVDVGPSTSHDGVYAAMFFKDDNNTLAPNASIRSVGDTIDVRLAATARPLELHVVLLAVGALTTTGPAAVSLEGSAARLRCEQAAWATKSYTAAVISRQDISLPNSAFTVRGVAIEDLCGAAGTVVSGRTSEAGLVVLTAASGGAAKVGLSRPFLRSTSGSTTTITDSTVTAANATRVVLVDAALVGAGAFVVANTTLRGDGAATVQPVVLTLTATPSLAVLNVTGVQVGAAGVAVAALVNVVGFALPEATRLADCAVHAAPCAVPDCVLWRWDGSTVTPPAGASGRPVLRLGRLQANGVVLRSVVGLSASPASIQALIVAGALRVLWEATDSASFPATDTATESRTQVDTATETAMVTLTHGRPATHTGGLATITALTVPTPSAPRSQSLSQRLSPSAPQSPSPPPPTHSRIDTASAPPSASHAQTATRTSPHTATRVVYCPRTTCEFAVAGLHTCGARPALLNASAVPMVRSVPFSTWAVAANASAGGGGSVLDATGRLRLQWDTAVEVDAVTVEAVGQAAVTSSLRVLNGTAADVGLAFRYATAVGSFAPTTVLLRVRLRCFFAGPSVHTIPVALQGRPPPEPTPALDDIMTTAGALSTVAGAVVTTASMQQGVAFAMLRIVTCSGSDDDDDVQPLPMLSHPLQFPVGSGPLRYSRGCVVGNCFVLPIVVVLCARLIVGPFVHFIIRSCGYERTIADVMQLLGWPSLVGIPFIITAEGAMAAIVTLAQVGDHPDKALAGVAFVELGVIIVLWFWVLYVKLPRRDMRLVRTPHSLALVLLLPLCEWEAVKATNSDMNHLLLVETSDGLQAGEDVSLKTTASGGIALSGRNLFTYLTQQDRQSHQSLATFVLMWRERCAHLVGAHWWLWAEFVAYLCALVVGAAEGTSPTSDTICNTRTTVAAVAAFVQALVCLTKTVPAEAVLTLAVSVSTIVIAVYSLRYVFGGHSTDDFEALQTAMAVNGIIGNVLMVFTLCQLSLEIVLRWNAERHNRALSELEDATRARALLDGSGPEDASSGAPSASLLSIGREEDDDGETELLLLSDGDEPTAKDSDPLFKGDTRKKERRHTNSTRRSRAASIVVAARPQRKTVALVRHYAAEEEQRLAQEEEERAFARLADGIDDTPQDSRASLAEAGAPAHTSLDLFGALAHSSSRHTHKAAAALRARALEQLREEEDTKAQPMDADEQQDLFFSDSDSDSGGSLSSPHDGGSDSSLSLPPPPETRPRSLSNDSLVSI